MNSGGGESMDKRLLSLAMTNDIVRPNWRFRFWRWFYGDDQDYVTARSAVEQAKRMMGNEAKEEIGGSVSRFSIIKAENGRILRFMREDESGSGNSRIGGMREVFHIVPEGEPLMEHIAKVMAIDRLSK